MTPRQKAGLRRLMLRLPERRAELSAVSDGTMLEIFESYDLAASAFNYWVGLTTPDDRAIAGQYQDMIAQLEAEIISMLDRDLPLVWPF